MIVGLLFAWLFAIGLLVIARILKKRTFWTFALIFTICVILLTVFLIILTFAYGIWGGKNDLNHEAVQVTFVHKDAEEPSFKFTVTYEYGPLGAFFR